MELTIPENIDLENPEFRAAWELLTTTQRSLFLTGKAGTGKSTFLKYICANIKKEYVVLAPTGIAAVNVGGVTLHSFFKMPFKPLLPDDPDFIPSRIKKTLKYPKDKVKLLKKLELIIIDEISMVRADMIDFMDKVLRVYSGNMRLPFGGKQLLFVGDIFQLEPVVTSDMREILRRYYKQFFFFNAMAFDHVKLVPIELQKIYRQTDSKFISLLDKVRVNQSTRKDIEELNKQYSPDYKESENDFTITLATRRDTVDVINEAHMNALKTKEYTFEGEIEGVFPQQNLPTSQSLVLKENAQVIFIKNDKEGRWVNGSIGRIYKLDSDQITVVLEDGELYSVEPDLWENVQYYYDEKEKKIKENVLGSFKQLPLKPAWALTVHKSQGLTFNKVIIDFSGGAFSSGQAYVALSRCTSLEGIHLLRPLSERDVILNTAIVDFSKTFNSSALINDAIINTQAQSHFVSAAKAFDRNDFKESVEMFAAGMKLRNVLGNVTAQRLIRKKLSKFYSQTEEIERLNKAIEEKNDLLKQLSYEYAMMGNEALQMDNAFRSDCLELNKISLKQDSISLKSALGNFNKALRVWPASIDALYGKAMLLSALGEYKESIALLKKVLLVEKNNFDALLMIARIYYAMDSIGDSVSWLKKAAKAKKTSPLPHLFLATIYEKIGMDELADEHMEVAKRLMNKQKLKSNKQLFNN